LDNLAEIGDLVEFERRAIAEKHPNVEPNSLQAEIAGWRDLFATKPLLRRVIVSCGVFWFQQVSFPHEKKLLEVED
jgi:hypothetical protein